MTIQEKYLLLRPQIDNGDILLIRGHSFLASGIQWADNVGAGPAYWNHALVVFKVGDRLLAIQSMAKGVEPDFLSTEVFANFDFCILKPNQTQEKKDICVDAVFDKAQEGIPYSDWLIPKVLIYRKIGWDIKKLGENHAKNICSVFAGITYGGLLPLNCYKDINAKQGFITPQDIVRFADPKEVSFIGEDNKIDGIYILLGTKEKRKN